MSFESSNICSTLTSFICRPALADLQQADAPGLAFPLLLAEPTQHVLAGGPAHHPQRRAGRRRGALRDRRNRGHHGPEGLPRPHLDDDLIARLRLRIEVHLRQQESAGPADRIELHAHAACRLAINGAVHAVPPPGGARPARQRPPADAAPRPTRLRRQILARQSSPSAPLGAQPTVQESAPFHGADSWCPGPWFAEQFYAAVLQCPKGHLQRFRALANFTAGTLDLQGQPVDDDARTGVPRQRRHRAIHGLETPPGPFPRHRTATTPRADPPGWRSPATPGLHRPIPPADRETACRARAGGGSRPPDRLPRSTWRDAARRGPCRPRAGASGAVPPREPAARRRPTRAPAGTRPEPASSAPRHAPVRGGRDGRRRRRRHTALAHQDVHHLVGREAAEPQLRAPRPHRRQQQVGTVRHEQEDRGRGRLLEGLEQRILRLDHQPVGVVDDDDAAAPPRTDGTRPARPPPRTASTLIVPVSPGATASTSACTPSRDPPARGTRSATLGNAGAVPGVANRLAVQQLGQTHRDLPLADAVGARQHQARRQPIPGDRPGQQAANRGMAPDRAEPHGAPSQSIVAVYNADAHVNRRTWEIGNRDRRVGRRARKPASVAVPGTAGGRSERGWTRCERARKPASMAVPGTVIDMELPTAPKPARCYGMARSARGNVVSVTALGVRSNGGDSRKRPRRPCPFRADLPGNPYTATFRGEGGMAGPTRLELATSGVTGRRSNQLNYDPASYGASEPRIRPPG